MKILKHFKSQILPWKVGKWTLSPHTKCPFWSLQPRSVPETLVKWEPSLGTERKSKPCRREAGHQPRAKWNRRDILARPELHSWQSWDWSWWRKPVDDLRVPATGCQVPDKVVYFLVVPEHWIQRTLEREKQALPSWAHLGCRHCFHSHFSHLSLNFLCLSSHLLIFLFHFHN